MGTAQEGGLGGEQSPDTTGTAVTTASGAALSGALVGASTWLDAHTERIDALNVFPVPDGDTGTNMSLTLRASAEALRAQPSGVSVGDAANAAYQAALMGARGNSGVILSQLLRGFAHALVDRDQLTAGALAAALGEASATAYRGLSHPVEGTILTVARAAGEAAGAAAQRSDDLVTLLDAVVVAAGAAVAATKDQLEALRKAGVVDSGGEGYRVILEGAWRWATGRSLDEPVAAPLLHAAVGVAATQETPYGFCTEVLLRDCSVPVGDVRTAMAGLGESVLAVGDGDLVRVHVHTLRPGRVLEYAVDHGDVVKVKVENMTLQNQDMAARAHRVDPPAVSPATGAIGLVAVATGDGFQKLFRSLGASVVDGSQSMNPSIEQLLAAADALGQTQVIVLPNNPNVILTARHLQDVTRRHVDVVPTTSVPQGVGALLAFNFQADMATNLAAMAAAANAVHTVEVTRAVRDAEVDDVSVRAGQAMGMYDGRVVAVAESAEDALLRVLDGVAGETLEVVTIYFGADASEEQAQALASRVRDSHPGLTVELLRGGQAYYPYVVSLE